MNQKNIKVGYVDESYSSDRNFLNLKHSQISFKRIYDFSLPHRVLRKMGIKYRFGFEKVFGNYFHDFNMNRIDLVHLFNRTSLGDTPWVTTFETRIPYWKPESKFEQKWFHKNGVKSLESESCKKIIAISRNAYDLQLSFLQKKNASTDKIIDKMMVLHPAQKLIVQKWKEKKIHSDDTLNIIMVGHQFFIKGGKEILTVVDRLLNNNADINLTIVSRMKPDKDNIETTQEEIDFVNNIIKKHGNHINHFNLLPNEDVLELFKKSHLAILSSFSETYGFSVLEAQAAGCPVITTDIRAFPENNNDRCGWLINVPKYENGYARLSTKKEKNDYSKLLVNGLYNIISDILSDPSIIKKKGNRAIDRIRKNHDPGEKAKILYKIYRQALSAEAV